jgi:hypothetical protein
MTDTSTPAPKPSAGTPMSGLNGESSQYRLRKQHVSFFSWLTAIYGHVKLRHSFLSYITLAIVVSSQRLLIRSLHSGNPAGRGEKELSILQEVFHALQIAASEKQ